MERFYRYGPELRSGPRVCFAKFRVLARAGPAAIRLTCAVLELLDDRYDAKSTLITSQLPVSEWHAYLADPTLADAIRDRFIHNAHPLDLEGDSMRKTKSVLTRREHNRER